MQEPTKPRRPRLPRKAGLVGLSLLAALALSGCWGYVEQWDPHGINPHQFRVTIHQQNTDDMIHACDHNPRGSHEHAVCVLAVVRWTCGVDPLPGFSVARCNQATSHSLWPTCVDSAGAYQYCVHTMRSAIAKVRANTAERLFYEHEYGYGPSHQWDAR